VTEATRRSNGEAIYEFGAFRLDTRQHQLSRDGVVVALTPKAFDTLSILVRRHGDVVSRKELIEQVWLGAFVEEGGLTRNISVLRKALAGDESDNQFIETVPKRGYRFTAAVLPVATGAPNHPAARVMVLPFRFLVPDPDLEFLSFSLADAVASSLSGIPGAIIRSSLIAARFGADHPELARIATEADVNRVIIGGILRAGDRVRVTAQLLDAPAGTLLGASSSEGAIGDLFHLQDQLVAQIVGALMPTLAGQPPPAIRGDVPASSRAYECYLRANQLAQRPADHPRALHLYRESVTIDPAFAPAWARLGRLYRVMSKYQDDGSESFRLAEHAFEQALALNPDLSLAQTQYALLEVDLGHGLDAMTRLIARARTHRTDPDLLAGMVHACRYAGLLDASIAAHRRAVEIDPLVATSVLQSYWMSGDVPLALAESSKLAGGSLRAMVLALAGRNTEAIAYLREQEATLPYQRMRLLSRALRTLLEGDRAASLAALDTLLVTTRNDPEARYFFARYLAQLGEVDRANDVLGSAVFGGFIASRVMAWDPWLDPLRSTASFRSVQKQADARYALAIEQFTLAGGEEILGPGSAA
jgi:DNA-binding winged helix-turn-helix (wHTH) protein/tetratricopeptide (TPR) repeat protein